MSGNQGFGKRGPSTRMADLSPSAFTNTKASSTGKSGGLFLPAIGVALAGVVAVLVAMNWDMIVSRFGTIEEGARANDVASATWQNDGPGGVAIDYMVFAFDPVALETAAPDNRLLISRAIELLADGDATAAIAMLDDADVTDPVTGYAAAVVGLHVRATDTIAVQVALRPGINAGLPQAELMLGDLYFKTALANVQGRPVSLRILDAAGNAVTTTVNQLLSESVRLWEVAASHGSIAAQRNLGMAATRGLTGRPNYVNALAIWEAAAARGDAISQGEAANLLVGGMPGAIASDIDRAIDYLRLAVAQDLKEAYLPLVYALSKPVLEGDTAAASEVLTVLDRALTLDLPLASRAALEDMYGHYLMEMLPAGMRYPVGAIDHWEDAVELGRYEAAWDVGEAYRLGNGRRVDPVLAYSYYLLAREEITNPGPRARLEALIDEVEPTLSAAQRERAERFANEIRSGVTNLQWMDEMENLPGATVRPLQADPNAPVFRSPVTTNFAP